jgi:predicted permease
MRLLRRLWYALRFRKLEADLAEELEFHRAMKQRELEDLGLEPRDAAFASRRALGSKALAQDRTQDVWRPLWLQGLGQDVRLAVRTLRSAPIVTAVVILSFALGAGANTAIFSLVNGLILRNLPVEDPNRLVMLSGRLSGGDRPQFSYATFDQIRRHGHAFDGASAYSNCCSRATLAVGGEPRARDHFFFFVSGDFFDMLGVRPVVGRLLTPADDVPGGGPAAVISHGLWQEQFGGEARVIGSFITLDRVPMRVVGVTPRNFLGIEIGRPFDVILPIKTEPAVLPSIPFDDYVPWLNVMLRMKPGASLASATAALQAVQPQIRAGSLPKQFASTFLQRPLTLEPADSGLSTMRERFQRPLIAVLAVVALVLLIASFNIANLQIARGAARRQELSIRLALGASRWRLTRQLFVESAVLVVLGVGLGFLGAGWAAQFIVSQLSTSMLPVVLDLSIDWRVLTFTAATMVTSAVLFGMVPAFRATRVPPMDALTTHGRTTADTNRHGGGWSSGLIIAQVALSLFLVVIAGLFTRTFERLVAAPLGFERDRTLLVTITASTVPAQDRAGLYHQLVVAAAAVPGVKAAGGSLNPPIAGRLVGDFVVTRPGEIPQPDAEVISQYMDITPGLLGAYGIPMRAGRDFDDRDTSGAQQVMLINEALAQRYFPGMDLIGASLALTFRDAQSDIPMGVRKVVGIVGDASYRSIRTPMRPTIYVPLAQRAGAMLHTNFYIAVRSVSGSPVLLTRSVEAALAGVNRNLTLRFQPLSLTIDDSLAQDRLLAVLSGFFGVLALFLAAIGLYGLTAYIMSRRRLEMGIRMALGSTSAGIVRLALARLTRLVGVGVVAGSVVSLWAVQFIAVLLYDVQPRDPLTLVGAVTALTAVAALAAGVPAWRASQLDPATVLRAD